MQKYTKKLFHNFNYKINNNIYLYVHKFLLEIKHKPLKKNFCYFEKLFEFLFN